MGLPETIAVKYTEEEAEYISMRPVVSQTFRAAELVDMIVRVSGKDSERVQQILRSGTIVFHSFRYWWQGFEPDVTALRAVLANYPDADSSRPFRAEECSEIILESSGSPPRQSLRVTREEVRKRRLLRSRSFWDCLIDFTKENTPRYMEYSYASQGDVYAAALSAEQVARLARGASRYASRTLRGDLAGIFGAGAAISQVAFICPRR
ncbi:MAG: hypothetical protein WAL95_17280 [Candidatus Acidiferrales bacterium]